MKKILFTTLICFGWIQLSAQHNTYYIGHSGFGWDLIVGEMVNDLAEDAGITTYDYGYQFIGGTCISSQWMNHDSPQGGTDSWTELPNGYDYVVLAEQIPIEEVINSNSWGCDMTSVEAVDSFYDMTVSGNPNAKIYLMEFHNEVDQTGPTPFATWSQMNTDMRPLWERVADSVSLINPGGPQVCIVPVASAFEAMVDSVMVGSFPGITNWIDLFDSTDLPVATIHPTEMTYYLVACVHYACIFGQSPVGLTNETFAAAGWQFDSPTPAQALMMQEIAWEIVVNDPYSCVSFLEIENPEDKTFNIFPNPSNGIVNFSGLGINNQLTVYDVSGRMILDTYSANGNLIQHEFQSGLYISVLKKEDVIITTKKFVVN